MAPEHFIVLFGIPFVGIISYAILRVTLPGAKHDDPDYDLYAFPLHPDDYRLMGEDELLQWRNGNRLKLGMPPLDEGITPKTPPV